MKKHYRKEQDCANCGTQLQGKFCHACGQENLELHESFGHMMNHAISDYFHFDHQFFHTLKPLFFQPGKLTVEYMAGKRVQYLHPVKMYIFISLVFFLLFFQTDKKENNAKENHNPKNKKELAVANKKLDSLIKDRNTNGLEKSILTTAKNNNGAVTITGDDDVIVDTSGTHKKVRNNVTFWEDDETGGSTRKQDTTYELYLAHQAKLSPAKRDNFILHYIRKREYELNGSHQKIGEVVLEGLKHYTPKMMFLLLPLFALLLRIAFWKNKKFYVEHLIYSFHFHCFLFLFLSIIMLVKLLLPQSWDVGGYFDFIAAIVIIWYSYQSLRVVYQRSKGRTITKMIGLFFSYSFVFAICLGILVMAVALFD